MSEPIDPDAETLPHIDNDITKVMGALAKRGFLVGPGEARAVLAALRAAGWREQSKQETDVITAAYLRGVTDANEDIISKGGKRPPGPPLAPPVAHRMAPAPPPTSGREIGPHKLEALAKTLHAWDSTHLWADVPGHERNVWLWKAQLAFEAMGAAQAEPDPLARFPRTKTEAVIDGLSAGGAAQAEQLANVVAQIPVLVAEAFDSGKASVVGAPVPEQPSAIKLVLAERERQIAKGWTPEHDDEHYIHDFTTYINIRNRRIIGAEPTNQRQCLVEIAALAVAAIESIDRRGVSDSEADQEFEERIMAEYGPPEEPTDCPDPQSEWPDWPYPER